MAIKELNAMDELKSLAKQLKLAYKQNNYAQLGRVINKLQKFVEENKGTRVCTCCKQAQKQKEKPFHMPPIAQITLKQKRKANKARLAVMKLLSAEDIDVKKQISKLLKVPLDTKIYIGIGHPSPVTCDKDDMCKNSSKQGKCDEH